MLVTSSSSSSSSSNNNNNTIRRKIIVIILILSVDNKPQKGRKPNTQQNDLEDYLPQKKQQ